MSASEKDLQKLLLQKLKDVTKIIFIVLVQVKKFIALVQLKMNYRKY